MKQISRRQFLKKAARDSAAITSCIAGSAILSSCSSTINKLLAHSESIFNRTEPLDSVTPVEPITNNIRSRLAIISSEMIVSNNNEIQMHIASSMIDNGIRTLTGFNNLSEAWLSLLPDLNETHTIGIKINCNNPLLPSHPEVTYAVAQSLIKAGIKPGSIIVWDRSEKSAWDGLKRCGYRVQTGTDDIRYLATNTPGFGYDEDHILHISSVKKDFPITSIMLICDHIINIPVLKDSEISGITGALKNFYGVIPLGDKFDLASINKMHRNNANPQIAEVYLHSEIHRKVRLNICDAVIGCYDGGPHGPPQWAQNQILMSTDPVALDMQMLQIIENQRVAKNLPSIMRKAKHIQTAAEMNLGANNPSQITTDTISI